MRGVVPDRDQRPKDAKEAAPSRVRRRLRGVVGQLRQPPEFRVPPPLLDAGQADWVATVLAEVEAAEALAATARTDARATADRTATDRTASHTASVHALDDHTADDHTANDHTADDRPTGDRPRGDRPAHERPAHDRPAHDPTGHDPTGHDPTAHGPTGHGPTGHDPAADQAAAGAPAPDADALLGAATGIWRALRKLDQHGSRLSAADLRQVRRYIRASRQSLADDGLEIQEHDGQPFDPGQSLEVLAFEDDPGLTGELVLETVRPSVYFRGDRIQMGQVVVGRPAPGRTSDP